MISNALLRALVVLALLLGSHALSEAASITWDFTGSGGSGSYGNSRTFTQNGVTVTVTAWGYTAGASDNAFEIAAVGQWSTGLGVCNKAETCADPEHQVDNVGPDDWVLFTFSTPVDPTSIRIDPYGTYDTDVSYWAIVTPSLNLTNKTYSDLSALGFVRVDQNGPTTTNPQDVSIISPVVSALLFGAQLGGEAYADRFKIASLQHQCLSRHLSYCSAVAWQGSESGDESPFRIESSS